MVSCKDKPIGVFDSGIGGLTVLKEIMNMIPGENTIYVGDTARLPYGNKSAETVIRYALEMTEFLIAKGAKLLVIACNTASAVSLPSLKARHAYPIVGVIEPGARRAVQVTRTGRVGVIGTDRTIQSGAYPRAIQQIDPGIQVFTQPCPLFVPLVEEGLSGDEIALLAAQRYLCRLPGKRIDALVLGCTHYPLLKRVIRKAIGDEIILVDSAKETAREVLNVLSDTGMLRGNGKKSTHQFYVTDYPERFQTVGQRFLGEKLGKVTRIKP